MATNLLFIYTDEQSTEGVGAYGNSMISTPNIDRLARESALFERAYVTQPVCTPSRSSLLTGLYPHTSGCTENNIPLPESCRCFPETAEFTGYRTAHIGKWHLGDEIFAQHGFQTWVSIEDGYRAYYRSTRDVSARSDYHHFLAANGRRPALDPDGGESFGRGVAARQPESLTKAAFVGEQAARFIEETAAERRPFILFANFFEPHMPFFGPRDEQYEGLQPPLPASFDDDLRGAPTKARLFRKSYRLRGHSGFPLATPDDWRWMIRRYWGLCSMVDAQVGRILDALERSGVDDDTVVVFTSDHGDMMGAHGLIGKCVMYEEAVRVPLLIRLPRGGTRGGRRIPYPVSQIDLLPTLLTAMEREVPEELPGRSLMSAVDGSLGGVPGRDVVIEWQGMNSGLADRVRGTGILPEWLEELDAVQIKAALADPVRTIVTEEGWKLNWSHRGEDALYDLRSDPFETANRVRESRCRDTVHALRERIEAWQQQTLDTVVFG